MVREIKKTGIHTVTCKICGIELHDIEYLRHLTREHRNEIEQDIHTKGQEQFDKEIEEEYNEPRIGPIDPAEIFWQ